MCREASILKSGRLWDGFLENYTAIENAARLWLAAAVRAFKQAGKAAHQCRL
jgi:hypothetical protein